MCEKAAKFREKLRIAVFVRTFPIGIVKDHCRLKRKKQKRFSLIISFDCPKIAVFFFQSYFTATVTIF